jgi:hypothetical protein
MHGRFSSAVRDWNLSRLPEWAKTVTMEARLYGTAFVFGFFCNREDQLLEGRAVWWRGRVIMRAVISAEFILRVAEYLQSGGMNVPLF